jgi:hypothetical protein
MDDFGPRQQETTVITNSNLTYGDVTISAFMQYQSCCPVPDRRPRIYMRTIYSIYDLPSLYTSTGDPASAENSYGSGIAPYRMYIVGTDFEPDRRWSAIQMWFTDDGNNLGCAVQNPFCRNLIWSDGNPPGYHAWFADKPSVAVSRNPATLGYVYVVAARADIDSTPNVNPNQLIIFRSTDGVTFNLTAVLSSNYVSPPQNPYLPSNAVTAPQIVVDTNGGVFVIWLDWSTNRIYAAKSGPDASNFILLPSLDAYTLNGPSNQTLPGFTPTIQALSTLNARANLVAHRVGIVWHAREGALNSNTNVFFAAINTDINTWTDLVEWLMIVSPHRARSARKSTQTVTSGILRLTMTLQAIGW